MKIDFALTTLSSTTLPSTMKNRCKKKQMHNWRLLEGNSQSNKVDVLEASSRCGICNSDVAPSLRVSPETGPADCNPFSGEGLKDITGTSSISPPSEWSASQFILNVLSSRWMKLSISLFSLGRRLFDWNIEVGFSAIVVWFKWVWNSRFSMDVIVRSNNNPVNDMIAPVSWLINDLDKVIKTKSTQSLFG